MAEREEGSESSDEESEVEWEDVAPVPSILNAPEPSLEQLEALKASQDAAGPSQPTSKPQAGSLEIVLERKAQGKNKKVKDHLEKAIAAFNRELRCNQHKVHLLCLVARGLYLSRQCDDIVRQGLLLSVLGMECKELVYTDAEMYTQNAVFKILKWLSNKMTTLHQTLKESMLQDEDGSHLSDAQLLVTLLRALGLRVRLVMVLNPISFKESKSSTKRKSVESSEKAVSISEENESRERMDLTIESDASCSKETKSSGKRKHVDSCEKVRNKSDNGEDNNGTIKTTRATRKKLCQSTDEGSSSSRGGQAQKKTGKRTQATKQQKQRKGRVTSTKTSPYFKKQTGRKSTSSSRSSISCVEEENPVKLEQSTSKQSSGSDSEYVPEKVKSKKRSLSVSSERTADSDDDDDDFEQPKKKRRRSSKLVGASPAKKLKEAADRKLKAETQSKNLKSSSKSTASRRKESKSTTATDSKDGDSSQSRGGSKNSSKTAASREKDSSLTINSDSNQSRGSPESVEIVKSDETACWAEVYLTVAGGMEGELGGERKEKGKKWRCVHLPSCSVDQPHLCEKHCTIPLNYVIAVENGCTVRDVTARYASNWCTHGRKQRLSEEWWEESLRPFEPSSQQERDAEEEDILSMLYAQPLPTSISDFKNHPLYALRRHLLKFEAIYPEESQILGYCKGEPVFARQCVHSLHTRETWLKEGRVVRIGEKAFKMVKARPKRGQSALDSLQNSTVEVFGRWQTEVYMAPPVVNGKVPRNEYGNVELFLPSMLPPGACHIKIQGISKVARKLDIDYAPAMVGWDFHSGYCHPILNGIVVAEEYEEVLREAWQQQEQILIEKDIVKREQRVLERWRKLTRGLLIRERVRRTYEMVNTTS